ncbi:MAG: hypothetical protein KDE33_04370, partial [Bacteroidetes bacterium]|nr:hypothetical protein [Bacteroidota bacterium]
AEGLFVLIENFCFIKRTFDLHRFASPQNFLTKKKRKKKKAHSQGGEAKKTKGNGISAEG